MKFWSIGALAGAGALMVLAGCAQLLDFGGSDFDHAGGAGGVGGTSGTGGTGGVGGTSGAGGVGGTGGVGGAGGGIALIAESDDFSDVARSNRLWTQAFVGNASISFAAGSEEMVMQPSSGGQWWGVSNTAPLLVQRACGDFMMLANVSVHNGTNMQLDPTAYYNMAGLFFADLASVDLTPGQEGPVDDWLMLGHGNGDSDDGWCSKVWSVVDGTQFIHYQAQSSSEVTMQLMACRVTGKFRFWRRASGGSVVPVSGTESGATEPLSYGMGDAECVHAGLTATRYVVAYPTTLEVSDVVFAPVESFDECEALFNQSP